MQRNDIFRVAPPFTATISRDLQPPKFDQICWSSDSSPKIEYLAPTIFAPQFSTRSTLKLSCEMNKFQYDLMPLPSPREGLTTPAGGNTIPSEKRGRQTACYTCRYNRDLPTTWRWGWTKCPAPFSARSAKHKLQCALRRTSWIARVAAVSQKI